MPFITRRVARAWLKPRPKNAHKGTSGRVLIVAGSKGMVGAGILSAAAAVRSGAGLVKLATVESQQIVAAKRGPLEATTLGLPEDKKGELSLLAWKALNKIIRSWRPDVIACGPGLGTGAGVSRTVAGLLAQRDIPVVLDADGLNVLAAHPKWKIRAPLLLTPHVGELSRLVNRSTREIQSSRILWAKIAACNFGAVCLLKGAGTIVTDGRKTWVNKTGNPAMASGGMGDVLTGMLAALLAGKSASGLETAALGAYLHGLAGDLALTKFPERSMTASDVIQYLPRAFRKIKGNL